MYKLFGLLHKSGFFLLYLLLLSISSLAHAVKVDIYADKTSAQEGETVTVSVAFIEEYSDYYELSRSRTNVPGCKLSFKVDSSLGTAIKDQDFTLTPSDTFNFVATGTIGKIQTATTSYKIKARDGLEQTETIVSALQVTQNGCEHNTLTWPKIDIHDDGVQISELNANLVGTQSNLNESNPGVQTVGEMRFVLASGVSAAADCRAVARIKVTGGTAKLGQDFKLQTTQVSFGSGDGSSKIVPININVLPGVAGDGNKTIELSAIFQAQNTSTCLLTNTQSQKIALTITDDPNQPLFASLSANKTMASEGETLQVMVRFSEAAARRLTLARRSIDSCTLNATWSVTGSAVQNQDYVFTPPRLLNYQKTVPNLSFPLAILKDNLPEEIKKINIGLVLAGTGEQACPLSSEQLTLSTGELAIQDDPNLTGVNPVEPEDLQKMACSSLRIKAGTTDTASDRDTVALASLSGKDRSFYASNCTQGTNLRNFEPEEIAAQANALLIAADRQLSNVRSRLEKLRTVDGRGLDVSGANLSFQGKAVPIGGAAGDESDLFANSRWGLFANGDYAFGDKDRGNDQKVSSGDRNFEFNSTGATVGVDYRMPGEKIVLGGAIGYKKFDASFTSQSGGTEMKGYNFSLYGSYLPTEKAYFDGVISFGSGEITSRRPVNNDGSANIGSQPTFAIGKPNAKEVTISLGGGYDFNQGKWTLTPYGRLDYIAGTIDKFTESASHISATTSLFSYEKQDIKSLTSAVGVRASQVISTAKGTFIPQASIEWKHEFEDRGVIAGQSIYIRDSDLNLSPAFNEKNADNFDKDYFNLAVGVSMVMPKGKSAYINFESRQGDSSIKDNAIKAGFRWEF